MVHRFDEIAINSTAKKKPEESDRFCYIGLEHIEPGTFEISHWGADAAPVGEKLIMRKGDILFGKRRAYQRKVAIAPFDGIFSAHGMVLRPKEEVICKEYFPFFLSSDQFMDTAIRISVGGLSPTINWKDLQQQEFDLPSLEEQRRLADKLWAAYELKEAYKKMIAATDEMVKAQFIEMFKSYQRVKLGSLATFINGSAFKPQEWSSTGIPIIRIQNLTNENDKFNYYHGDLTQKILVDNGDILISWSATLGIYVWNGDTACLNQHIFKVIFNKIDIDRTFFIYTVNNVLQDMYKSAHGSTMRHVTKGTFDSTLVVYPPKELQKQFVIIAEQAEKSKSELRQAIEKIDRVMKSLMQ